MVGTAQIAIAGVVIAGAGALLLSSGGSKGGSKAPKEPYGPEYGPEVGSEEEIGMMIMAKAKAGSEKIRYREFSHNNNAWTGNFDAYDYLISLIEAPYKQMRKKAAAFPTVKGHSREETVIFALRSNASEYEDMMGNEYNVKLDKSYFATGIAYVPGEVRENLALRADEWALKSLGRMIQTTAENFSPKAGNMSRFPATFQLIHQLLIIESFKIGVARTFNAVFRVSEAQRATAQGGSPWAYYPQGRAKKTQKVLPASMGPLVDVDAKFYLREQIQIHLGPLREMVYAFQQEMRNWDPTRPPGQRRRMLYENPEDPQLPVFAEPTLVIPFDPPF